MATKEKNLIFLYRGPGAEVPWHEMAKAIRARLGRGAVLSLTLTCDVADAPNTLQPATSEDRTVPATATGSTGVAKRSTIYDVAREAGVSHTTVHRVVNDQTRVRPALRARVEAAMARLDYKPNAAAIALVHSRDEKRRNLKHAGERTATPDAAPDDNRLCAVAAGK